MSGEQLSFKKHLKLPLGAYCQVHEKDLPRNSQVAHTKGAICMGPSGNQQGGYHFIALSSGKRITRRSWDELPMPDVVIARVNALRHDQPELMTFTDRHGWIFGNDEIPGVDPLSAEEANTTVIDDAIIEIPGVNVDTYKPHGS